MVVDLTTKDRVVSHRSTTSSQRCLPSLFLAERLIVKLGGDYGQIMLVADIYGIRVDLYFLREGGEANPEAINIMGQLSGRI